MKPKWQKTNHPAVFVWHEVKKTKDGPKPCPAYDGGRCRCRAKYRGEVWNATTKRPDKQSPAVFNVNEAIGWVADYRRGVESPAPVEISGVIVREFFDAFMASARAGTALRKGGKRYAPRTLNKYARDFRHHVDPHAGEKPINGMDAPAWQVVVEAIITTGQRDRHGNPTGHEFGAATVNTIMAGIRAAYRWGSAPGRRIVTGNPLREVQIPQGGKAKRKRVAAPETIPVLLDALVRRTKKRGPAPNPAIRIAWAIMFYAGLRVSEAVALDWADILLPPRFDSTADWHGEIVVGESKSEAGTDRRIPIAAPLAHILNNWKRERGGFVIGPVIPGTRTVRATDSGVASAATARWKEAGLEAFSPHEARHTFASTVIASRDVSLADLQEWLGHASLATTAIYVKTLPGFRSESAGARISGAFG
jgi:integrase